jgi:tetratricopeptide (TPR) repeat protein
MFDFSEGATTSSGDREPIFAFRVFARGTQLMKSQRFTFVTLAFILCMSPVNAQDRAAEIRQNVEAAQRALGQNDLAQAEQAYRTILRLDPNNADVHTALGVLLYRSGKLTEAVSCFQSALRLDMAQKRADLFLGLSQADLGQCGEASPILMRYFPDESDSKLRRLAGLSLLNCDLSSENLDGALDVARKLRRFYPDDPDVLYKSAELYTRLWDQAAGELIGQHPDSYRVHQLAGEVLEVQGKAEQATKEYGLALQQNSRIPQLHYRAGQLLLRQGGADSQKKALQEFEAELEVNPQAAPAEYAIGEVYRGQQDFEHAVQHYARAAEMDPHFADPHIGLAQVLLAQHSPDKAQPEAEVAVRLDPKNSTAHYTLMLAYRAQHKMAEAGQEMATFQRLQEESNRGFTTRLHSLLTGEGPEKQASH